MGAAPGPGAACPGRRRPRPLGGGSEALLKGPCAGSPGSLAAVEVPRRPFHRGITRRGPCRSRPGLRFRFYLNPGIGARFPAHPAIRALSAAQDRHLVPPRHRHPSGFRSAPTSCPRPRERAATPGGRPSPAAAASTPAARCSGRRRRWSRPNSSAWVLPPSPRTSTATSLSARSPSRPLSAAPSRSFSAGGVRRLRVRPSVARGPVRPGRSAVRPPLLRRRLRPTGRCCAGEWGGSSPRSWRT